MGYQVDFIWTYQGHFMGFFGSFYLYISPDNTMIKATRSEKWLETANEKQQSK